jgi:acylphosphatase
MSECLRRQVVVRGRVQGVYFRAFVERESLKAGIEGWVRNRSDGSVEALFAGPADKVQAIIEACRRGPSAARVDALDERAAADAEFNLRRPGDMFSVLPDA